MYVDEVPKEPTQGTYLPEWGLKVNEDFNLISALPTGRYLTRVDGYKTAIKMRSSDSLSSGRKNQVWYFNYKTRTIFSKENKQSLHV